MESVADLEDGEICSDGESEKKIDPLESYNVTERPDPSCSKYVANNQNYRNVTADSINYSSDEDEDYTDGNSPIKKARFHHLAKDTSGIEDKGGYKQDPNWVKSAHSNILKGANKGKKPNNIWGAVLQEESMSKCVNQLNRNENISYTERGAESYDYTRSKLDVRLEKDKEEEKETTTDSSSESEDDEDEDNVPADLTAKESFGFTVDKRPSIKSRLGKKKKDVKNKDSHRNVKSRLGKKTHEDGMDVDGGSNKSDMNTARKGFSNTNRKRKHDTVGGIFDVEHKPMKMNISVRADMEVIELADVIVDALHEPPDKLDFVVGLVEALGADKVVKHFKATEDVESMGGLMIQNNYRRRTPGGVFFYLIRNDTEIDQKTIDKLFAAEYEKYKKNRQKQKKQLRRKNKDRKRNQISNSNAEKSAETEVAGMEVLKSMEQETSDEKMDKLNEMNKSDSNDFDFNDADANIELA